MSEKDFNDIKQYAKDIVSRSSERDIMFDEINDMYWMEDRITKVGDRDDADVKLTISPSARNEVVGMVRLMTTTSPRFIVSSDTGDGEIIERALNNIIKYSNQITMTKVDVEASRSAILYSDVHMIIESVDDMIGISGIPDYEKRRLEEIKKRTPFLLQVINPREGYPIFGKTGLRAYLRRYKARGDDLFDRWGVKDLDYNTEYTVNDWYGMKYRAVWIDEDDKAILFAEHGMPTIPIVVRISDGTELFGEEERKRQPFLYAKWKGNWWKRENLLYTTLFTSIFERGTGPLAALDPTSIGSDGTVDINYAGAFRYIVGRAQLLNDKAFDNDLLNAKGLLDSIGSESTIYKQTLGENVGNSNTAYSTLALLSQSGRLPLISPQNAVSDIFREASYVMMNWIKSENIKNSLIKASEIPDDMNIECKMEVNLPQDMFKNAQIAAQLKGLVSGQWIHENLLQIDDTEKMKESVWSEETADMLFQMQLQQMQQQMQMQMQQQQQQMQMQMQMQMQQQQNQQQNQQQQRQQQMMMQQQTPPQNVQTQSSLRDMMAQQELGNSPQGIDPQLLAMMRQQGGEGMSPEQAAAGGQRMPMQNPLPIGGRR